MSKDPDIGLVLILLMSRVPLPPHLPLETKKQKQNSKATFL